MRKYDALVIGASVGGLAAAAILAGAGKRVLLLEQQAAPPEPIGPVYALDPLLLSQLRLSARGLRFISRDLPLAMPAGAMPAISAGPGQPRRGAGAQCASAPPMPKPGRPSAGSFMAWPGSCGAGGGARWRKGAPDWVLEQRRGGRASRG